MKIALHGKKRMNFFIATALFGIVSTPLPTLAGEVTIGTDPPITCTLRRSTPWLTMEAKFSTSRDQRPATITYYCNKDFLRDGLRPSCIRTGATGGSDHRLEGDKNVSYKQEDPSTEESDCRLLFKGLKIKAVPVR